MQGNPYAEMVVGVPTESAYALPPIGASASVGTSGGGVNASVQVTGVVMLLVIVAIVLMAKNWPILK